MFSEGLNVREDLRRQSYSDTGHALFRTPLLRFREITGYGFDLANDRRGHAISNRAAPFRTPIAA